MPDPRSSFVTPANLTDPPISLPPPPADLLGNAALFLDFDGTLVEIATRPDAIVVGHRVHCLLAQLVDRLGNRVAVVSGRPIAQLRHFLGPISLALAGSHGAELCWPDGRSLAPAAAIDLAPLLAGVDALRAIHPALLAETKPFGFAIHYRAAPEAESASLALAKSLAAEYGLVIQTGKMVVELRLPGSDKGIAVEALLASPAMAGTVPVFVGDDATDEAGFVVAAAHGGAGILVGPDRPTAAVYRLDSVAATLDWLDAASGPGA